VSDNVAIIAGATGLVGQALVASLAADPAWKEVRALVRRELPPELAAQTVVPVPVDYTRLDPPPPWAAADHVFCALGTTIRQAGSQAAFRLVDFEYPVALAKAALASGCRHFLLVSSVDASPSSRFFYTRVKGEVEGAIGALGFRSVTIARPSLLLGPRKEVRWGERVGRLLGVFAPARWRPVSAERVARALVKAAKRDLPGVRLLENVGLRSEPALQA
jgi:uncharacterized protein YbjT (DUF2867 family)